MGKLSSAKEEQLLRYLDGELDAAEKIKLDTEIQSSSLLKTRLNELETVRSFLIHRATLEIPSRNFTQKIMERLDAQPVISLYSPRKGLLLFVGVIIASGILVTLTTYGVFDQTSTSLILDTSPLRNKWMQDVSLSIPFNGKILMNGIIFLTLGLALILLDRTILRPLFQRRTSSGY